MKILTRLFLLSTIFTIIIFNSKPSNLVSAAQVDYGYKRAITLTYSGSTLTDHDVESEIENIRENTR